MLTTALLAFRFTLLGLTGSAVAADAPPVPSDADVRWICQQQGVARIRVTGVALQAPDAPCASSKTTGADDACRFAVVDAIVLDSLPLLGAQVGLLTSDSRYLGGPSRLKFRLASRENRPIRSPSADFVGVEVLIGMPELRLSVTGDPVTLPLGVVVPSGTPPEGGLETLCKPFRHWSGQRKPAFPETLPGVDPLALDGENELAEAIASLIAKKPPNAADIESRFGVRMLAAIPFKDGRSDDLTLVRLPQRWILIRRESLRWEDGRSRVIIVVKMTSPLSDKSAEPWWNFSYLSRPPEMGYCITPWMVFNAMGPLWMPPPPDDLIRFTERMPEARYDVSVDLGGPVVHSPHGPLPTPYSPYRCVGDIRVIYDERPEG